MMMLQPDLVLQSVMHRQMKKKRMKKRMRKRKKTPQMILLQITRVWMYRIDKEYV